MTLNLKNLLNPKVKMSKMGEFQELQPINGLEISAVSADLYGDGRDDVTLFYFPEGANFGGVYTTSKVTSVSAPTPPAVPDIVVNFEKAVIAV